ncbi:MAG: ABC transporter substrate-binding protein [Thermodesulfobacteriota bacterium]|nr:ABC transporter substrate-binding protein [Thermodesulfobacteriota bacterium]
MSRDHFFSFYVFNILVYGIILCLGSISTANAAKLPDPTEQFRPFVEEMVTILTDPDLLGEGKNAQRREKAMTVASEHFDFHEMSKRVLGKTWRKLSKDEQEYFTRLFTRLLEHAYVGKIEGYSNQKVVFKGQRVKGERAQVLTDIIDKDTVITVSYIMILKDGVWKVYDIVVEGVSLVRNYMDQFREILRKEEYASLLKQVEDKVTELETSNR